MKNNRVKYFCIGAMVSGAIAFSGLLNAQAPPPPPPPGSHGSGTNQSPMGAPIDGGLTVFLAFALGYGGREWMKNKKKE